MFKFKCNQCVNRCRVKMEESSKLPTACLYKDAQVKPYWKLKKEKQS